MIYVLCGNIASGKSTVSRCLASDRTVVFNDDALVEMLCAGEASNYKSSHLRLYKQIETNVITTAVTMGLSVVVDRPCHTRMTRSRYVSIARAMGVGSMVIVTPRSSPLEHASRRERHDTRGEKSGAWLRVANRIDKEYEEPSSSEGFNRIVHLTSQNIMNGDFACLGIK